MKITYFRGHHPNFGDELNLWLWPRLLPDFFNEDEKELFIGIGSTIGNDYNAAAKKIIFGAGFVPEYNTVPDVHNDNWKVYFVRGRRTAKTLGIPAEMGVGDAAILLRTLVDASRKKPETVSFIPHWESMMRGNWERVCRQAGITLIDPRQPVDAVIDQLLKSKLVIAEAMHGAIVADALRIPWIPVFPIDNAHQGKWYDWASALDIELKPQKLWPSGIPGLQLQLRENHPLLKFCVRTLKRTPLSGLMEKCIISACAWRLKRIARIAPSLSSDTAMEQATRKMQEMVEQLRRDYAA